MVIYGRKSMQLEVTQDKKYDCLHCNEQKSVSFVFYQNCYHIYWIPLFPLGKYGTSYCSHCQEQMYEVQMEPELQHAFKEQFKEMKTPFKYWVGLMILAGLVLYSFIK